MKPTAKWFYCWRFTKQCRDNGAHDRDETNTHKIGFDLRLYHSAGLWEWPFLA